MKRDSMKRLWLLLILGPSLFMGCEMESAFLGVIEEQIREDLLDSGSLTFTVTYDGNGASGGVVPVDLNRYAEGTLVTVSGPGTMNRNGYHFLGWNRSADGSGTAYSAGGSFPMGGEDIILYAQWAAFSGLVPPYGGYSYSSQPLLNWADVTGASGYQMRCAAVMAELEMADIHDATVSEYQYPGTLADGDLVYWQIRAVNSGGDATEWSNILNFTAELSVTYGAPVPAAGGTTMDTSPLLSWPAVPGAASYHIRIASDSGGLEAAPFAEVNGPAYQYPGVLSLTDTLYWQIRAVDAGGVTASWMAPVSFSISWPVSYSPVTPQGTTVETRPLLDWNDVSGAVSYNVRWEYDQPLDGATVYSVTDSEYQIEEVCPNFQPVFWQIQAVNEDGVAAPWCAALSFDIWWDWDVYWDESARVFPEYETVDSTPLLDWPDLPGAVVYRLRYADTETGLDSAEIVTLGNSEYQYPQDQPLALGDEVYWDILAVNSDGIETQWLRDSFWVDTAFLLGWSGFNDPDVYWEEVYTAPALSPLLDWPEVAHAVSYRVRYALAEEDLPAAGVTENITGSQYQVPETFSFFDTVYWQIAPVNAEGVVFDWLPYSFMVEINYNVGDYLDGGIIFFLDGAGGGLMTAPDDQGSAVWGSNGNTIGATATLIGTGPTNTAAVVAALGDNGGIAYAAGVCDGLDLLGFTDWFLPSKDELLALYNNLKLSGMELFSDGRYWSSSEVNDNGAYCYDFSTGQASDYFNKNEIKNIRAVRAFTY